jgi:hypothetical protein
MRKRIPNGLAVVLFVVGFPIIIPVSCVLHLIRKRKLHRLAHITACQTCGKTLGLEALRLADAEWSAHVAELHKQNPHIRLRLLRTLHAICPHCKTRYTYFGTQNEFRIETEGCPTTGSTATNEPAAGGSI